ncbi:GNAT family N-acetyltransferase [uncultured Polaribacter sp.]|uniref:GNAT family N-acetyltransferase n=1 Tax=uncultured Polaribacter sp. TaxID=174711 RepID=UPI00262AA893|nr:GNAT family N-acetyltransferase [uncultured Polaribacter sp.]
MKNSHNIYKTDRLILRPTNQKDSKFIFELFNTPSWIRYIGDKGIKTIEDAENYIEKHIISQQNRLGFSTYTLIRQIDNKKIGTCGLYDRDGIDGIDIGFALKPEFESMGFAFEASKKIISICFNDFKIKSIKAITTPINLASQKLLLKLGFKTNGKINLPNNPIEYLSYELR